MILMARDEDEAPEDLVGEEFIDYMNKKKAESEATINKENAPSKAGQNVKTNYVPQNQLDRQALNRKLRDEQKKEQFVKQFKEDHPTLVKGAKLGAKIIGTVAAKINAAGQRFVDDQNKIDGVKTKKATDKKKSKSKKDEEEEEDDEDMEESSSKKMSSGNKPQLQLGNYKPAYSNDTGIFGSKNYSPTYKSQMGADTYRPAYKTPSRKEATPEELVDITKISKRKSGDITPRAISTPQTATIRAPDRFNTQNWQSLGFPNTLPQNARGSLFTTAPQPAIKNTLQTPRHTMPKFTSPNVIPMSGSMPRIGGMSLISGNLPTIASPALNSAKKSVGELPQLTMMGQPLNGIGKKRKK